LSHPLLTAPVGRALLRLAGPTTSVMALQIVVALVDIWIVARLGTDTLAGMALVFPVMALMVNSANGAMGGSVASALARALGAGRRDDANAIVLHALVLALAIGAAFTLLAWTAAPVFYQWLGGSDGALGQALAFSNLWYAGAVVVWLNCFLAALLRGAGDAGTPARIGITASLLYMPLAGGLAWRIGIVGPAIASLAVATGAAILQARAVRRGRLGFVPILHKARLQGRLFGEILRVGALGSLSTVAASLTALLVTALVGRFGTAALAGYGIGVRLEFMVAPIAFGIGTGATTLVGIAVGAGDFARAVRVAWLAGLVAFMSIGAIGWLVALAPEVWSRLFTTEPDVLAASVAYVTRAAPAYCFFGLGLTIYFASQGANRMAAPVLAAFLRLAVATAGGWFAAERLGLGLDGLFAATGCSLALYGTLIAAALFIMPWRAKSRTI
jgi:putative MATE family efflux protein